MLKKFAEFKIGFEVYLQFDSFKKEAPRKTKRVEDYEKSGKKAIENLMNKIYQLVL